MKRHLQVNFVLISSLTGSIYMSQKRQNSSSHKRVIIIEYVNSLKLAPYKSQFISIDMSNITNCMGTMTLYMINIVVYSFISWRLVFWRINILLEAILNLNLILFVKQCLRRYGGFKKTRQLSMDTLENISNLYCIAGI